MIKIKDFFPIAFLCIAFSLFLLSCERDIEELEEASASTNGAVFIDGFTGDLNYAAFGGSDVTAFEVVNDVVYSGNASMRFAVPDFGDPKGAYAGGVFFTSGGRDLSGYDALTFWAKSSQPASIDILGFGNDLGENKFETSIRNVALNTNWRKFYIPIPDPSKFTSEKGMFFYSEGPENERGYTFWIDEVQFESLGTIAHATATIMGGEDVVQAAETGAVFNVNASATFNLPNGTDLEVFPSSAFFNFTTTDGSVATVNDAGVVTVMDAGTATITASLGEMAAEGSLTIESTGQPVLPLTAAPTPDEEASKVISLFSNAYTDEPVDFYNGFWEFSTTQSDIVQVDNDDIIRYTQLNFVGIQFTAPTIDISQMTHFHLDIWTPEAVAGKEFKVLLVDLGADGTFDGGDNTSHEITISGTALASQSWISLDIPLSDFAGLTTKRNLAQVVLSGNIMSVFADNMYFYQGDNTGGPDGPTSAAPTPNVDPNDVISVFSDSYTNLPGADLNPDWGQQTIVTQENIQGNNTLKYTGLNYQGLDFGGSVDISSMENLHIDYWTSNSSTLSTFLISTGPQEMAYNMPVPTNDWGRLDIPLSEFAGVDLADVIQMKFEGNGTIYLDNIYYYRGDGGGGGGGDAPDMAAPTPDKDPNNVLSVYSDTYTNIDNSNLNPDWGQATMFSEEMIEGNNTIKLEGLDYQGIEFGGSEDVSGLDFLHIDVWTNNSTAFDAFLISMGPMEVASSISVPTNGWSSVDIPLSVFASGVDLSDVFQMKFVGNGTVYLDNIYFFKDDGGGGGGDAPDMAAPTPSIDANNVISIYSDAYTNIGVSNLNPDWGQGTIFSEEMIEGNTTIKLTGLDYQGIEFGSNQDVSGLEFVHVDIWTNNSTAFDVFLISPGPLETPSALSVPTSGWQSFDIPLSDFGGVVNLSEVFQMKFVGNGTIYMDNIYFYKN